MAGFRTYILFLSRFSFFPHSKPIMMKEAILGNWLYIISFLGLSYSKYTTSVVLLSSPFLAVSPLCRRSSFSDRNIGISCGIAVIHFSFDLGGRSSSPGWKVIIISFSKFFLQFVSTGRIGGMYKPLLGPVCGGIPWKEGAKNRAWQIDWRCCRLSATLFCYHSGGWVDVADVAVFFLLCIISWNYLFNLIFWLCLHLISQTSVTNGGFTPVNYSSKVRSHADVSME